jgi:hypothetical protein
VYGVLENYDLGYLHSGGSLSSPEATAVAFKPAQLKLTKLGGHKHLQSAVRVPPFSHTSPPHLAKVNFIFKLKANILIWLSHYELPAVVRRLVERLVRLVGVLDVLVDRVDLVVLVAV